jgi:hypothetical protein
MQGSGNGDEERIKKVLGWHASSSFSHEGCRYSLVKGVRVSAFYSGLVSFLEPFARPVQEVFDALAWLSTVPG